MSTCTLRNCDRPLYAGSACEAHYARRRKGNPSTARVRPYGGDPALRFWPKVHRREVGCWLWTGATQPGGYGTFWNGKTVVLAHRWAYEQEHGPIGKGLTLDHLCRNRACVRPDHLEPVPLKENTRRGDGPTAINERKTHCPQGHPFDADNTGRGTNGGRVCLACKRAAGRAYMRRRRAALRQSSVFDGNSKKS